jgi:hypothetical protein
MVIHTSHTSNSCISVKGQQLCVCLINATFLHKTVAGDPRHLKYKNAFFVPFLNGSMPHITLRAHSLFSNVSMILRLPPQLTQRGLRQLETGWLAIVLS